MRTDNDTYRSLNESINAVQNPQVALHEAQEYASVLEAALEFVCEKLEITPDELMEMAVTAARAREHNRAIDRADHRAWAYTNPNNRQGMWKDGKAKSPAHIKKGKGLEKAYDSAVKKLDKERASKTLYGRGGKVLKSK